VTLQQAMTRLALPFLLILLAVAPAAHAASAPDAGAAFEPRPKSSQPLYGVKKPADDPARQEKTVTAADGTALYVETWLPAAKDGNEPPARIPTVLIMTPYVQKGQERYPARNLEPAIAWFTARGYAVAQHHVRGTGQSGGCLEQTADNQIDDAARVIEYLGRDASWSNGNVGMYGHSYDAETQVSVAGRGDRSKTRYLKAIVPSATVGSQYEYSNMDGVPFAGQALLSNTTYLALTSLNPGTAPIDEKTFERFGCQPELFAGSVDYSGNVTPFWQVREYRTGAPNITAATLWVHGLSDWNVQPITMAGFFDRLPASTPRAGLFGIWEHNYPDKHAGVRPEWARQDFLPMVTAWYDQHLKGRDAGTDAWPEVQLQGNDGQWRTEQGFPQTGGPAGQLALGPEGVLGATAPKGSTSFREGPDDTETVRGTRAVFETPKVTAPLHLTGQPVADLWLQTDRTDGHVTVKLQVLDKDGGVLRQSDTTSGQEVGTYGARSLQHLDPMPDNWFKQEQGRPVPANTPLRVQVRFQPNDLVVPAGGRVRLTVAGATSWARDTVPSGSGATIQLLHDCAHPSALRFLMPWSDAPQLNVRETDEKDAGPLPSNPAPARETDGGGIGSAPVCGKAPERLDMFGPVKRPEGARGITSADVRRAEDRAAVVVGGASGFTEIRRGNRRLAVAVDRRRKVRALAGGMRVRVRCSGGCRLRFRVLSGRRVVGSAKSLRNGAGRRTRMLRFTRSARRSFARRRSVSLTVEVTAYDAANRPLRVLKRIRLR
jgi:X-Pro dipeptidyl-peptidase